VFALWTQDVAAAVLRLDDEGERLWSAVRDAWTDEGGHDTFLKHCSGAGLLAVAGRRYRERIDESPAAPDPIAVRMRERIVTMATMIMPPPRTVAAPVTRSRWFWVVLAAAAAAGILGGLVFTQTGR
jgi:hypothetical protein